MKLMSKSKVVFLMATVLLLSSCGQDGMDGDPGKVYLKINLGSNVVTYWDNNPNIPYGFTEGRYYECSGGRTYDYEYTKYSEPYYYEFEGTYTLPAPNPGEPGEEGRFLMDGEDGDDGEDIYRTLSIYKSSEVDSFYSFSLVRKYRKEKNNSDNKIMSE